MQYSKRFCERFKKKAQFPSKNLCEFNDKYYIYIKPPDLRRYVFFLLVTQSSYNQNLVDDSFAKRSKLRACYCRREFRLFNNKAHLYLPYFDMFKFGICLFSSFLLYPFIFINEFLRNVLPESKKILFL